VVGKALKIVGAMQQAFLRIPKNEHGRDFAVGDIHGYFSRLQESLDAMGFDPSGDRLF
jgi:serine/threonine protein phosphatase 1